MTKGSSCRCDSEHESVCNPEQYMNSQLPITETTEFLYVCPHLFRKGSACLVRFTPALPAPSVQVQPSQVVWQGASGVLLLYCIGTSRLIIKPAGGEPGATRPQPDCLSTHVVDANTPIPTLLLPSQAKVLA